jgi:hypothetical protein
MPDNVAIAVFVFGAILILIAIIGGEFKLFGSEISKSVTNKWSRFFCFLFGVAFLVPALDIKLPLLGTNAPLSHEKTPVQEITPTSDPTPNPTSIPTPTPTPTQEPELEPKSSSTEVYIPEDITLMWVFYQDESIQSVDGCERAPQTDPITPSEFKNRIDEFISIAQSENRDLIITSLNPKILGDNKYITSSGN